MSDRTILKLQNIRKSYRMGSNTLEVLKGVDFELACGQWCCIYGASGSGKTTLLNLIGLLENADSGTLEIAGENVSNFSRKSGAAFRRNRIGFVFQSYHLLPELTVLENVTVAGRIAGLDKHSATAKARQLLVQMGLAGRLDHRPVELSGGEQQRTAIARSLVNSPELLLADEPTGNLDPETGNEILELFADMRRSNPALSIVMITHNHQIAARADVAVELSNGVFVPFEKMQ